MTIIASIASFKRASRSAGQNYNGNSSRQNSQAYNNAYRQLTGRNSSSGRVSTQNEQRNETISDANAERIEKQVELGSRSSKGYDDYQKQLKKSRRQSSKTTTGYDRTYIDTQSNRRRQYSHTFDGHEPWDDCLPKEKDPWDKDFYAGRG